MNRARILLATTLACFCAARPVKAIEVSLEENKVAKGSVGFVDMKLLFKVFPETQKAKQGFEEAVRQTEEQINLRRAEIIGIRSEIARLKAERELAVKSSSAPLVNLTPMTGSSPSAAPLPSGPNTSSIGAPNIPGMDITTSTSAASRVATSTATTPGTAVAVSTAVVSGTPSIAISSGAAPASAHIADLTREIDQKSKLLETKETDFKSFEAQAEKSLLDLESRKSEVLLGRIYGAIQDVAKAENISVVVDKSQILFGHRAVDLTDKVAQKLKSETQ